MKTYQISFLVAFFALITASIPGPYGYRASDILEACLAGFCLRVGLHEYNAEQTKAVKQDTVNEVKE